MRRSHWLLLFAATALATSARQLVAEPTDAKPAKAPRQRVAAASDEGEQALKRCLRMPEGMTGSLWAAEPLLANPVCFCFDEKGRCFVAETFRLHKGVTDNRSHMNWLDDDLASRTIADRVAMYRKYLKKNFPSCETESDRVSLLEDTKGQGVADKATVFAEGFQPRRRRYRRGPAGLQGQRLVYLHPRPLAAARHARSPGRPT